MSFLHNNESEYLAARITNKGRQKIAEGNFNISYFQLGDSEFDYNFPIFDGTDDITNPAQKVFIPLDKDSFVKYPYRFSESGTTFGIPIQSSQTDNITNKMGESGFVSRYIEYNEGVGSFIECYFDEIDISTIDGSTDIVVTSGSAFNNCEYITFAFTQLIGDGVISGSSNSQIYKIISIDGNTITVDRNTPDLSGFSGFATVICNNCFSSISDPCAVNEDNLGPWTLNIVWSQKPAGMDVPTTIDEELSGYTSNVFVSTKEFLGYNTSSGQTTNTGTTISNSFGDVVMVTPEEQHSLAIVHYNQINTEEEPDRFYKYEDYIAHQNSDDIEYFEVYIPFLYYHRNDTGSTIGAIFSMDSEDRYISSSSIDTKLNKLKYRYLKDEHGDNVGKIFVNNKIIVFDDQEIVAALDYKSNRKYTLPAPRVGQISMDTSCCISGATEGLMDATTGETVFITYLFQYTGDTYFNGMHCNYYMKVTGTTLSADVSVKFNTDEFKFMKNQVSDYVDGYIANKFYILVQKVDTGTQPLCDQWKLIDFTDEIPNHTVGDLIDPVNMRGSRFIITSQKYDDADFYDIEDFLGTFPDEPSTDPQFGDEQPFPGSIKLSRAIDIQVLRFLINLPVGEFDTTQNPSWAENKPYKVITEAALLDNNKDVLVVAKTPKPIVRYGTQVLSVKLDF